MKFKIFNKINESLTECTSLSLNKCKSFSGDLWEIEKITKFIKDNKFIKLTNEKDIYNPDFDEETINKFYEIECKALIENGYKEIETKENNFITIYKDSILL